MENKKKVIVAEEEEPKLYECQQCGKKVPLDDFNAYFGLCYTCEQKGGGHW